MKEKNEEDINLENMDFFRKYSATCISLTTEDYCEH